MELLIIAGGKGSRLGLKDIPKPMVPVAGVPLLERQINLAHRYGFDKIRLLVGHLAHVIQDYFRDGASWNVEIKYTIEREPLGTAGAVKQLDGIINDYFMVMYGDVVLDMNLRRLAAFACKKEGIGTLVVHPNDHPYDSDLLEIDDEKAITAFYPKPHEESCDFQNLVSAALYVLNPNIFQFIQADEPQDFGRDVFPRLIASGEKLFAYKTSEYIKDSGTPQRLDEVGKDLQSGKISARNIDNKQCALFLDRDGVINTEVGPVLKKEDFSLAENAAAAVKLINKSRYLAIIVTNQAALSKGFMSFEDLRAIHKKMESLLGKSGAFIDGLYFCPHYPESGYEGEVTELKIDCSCRKPKPGMLEQAAEDFNIDLAESYIIGDRLSDCETGKNAGVKATILLSDHDRIANNKERNCSFSFKTLKDAVSAIVEGKI
jgi:D,D-heptose 1,7-bisphosphate phosphatase